MGDKIVNMSTVSAAADGFDTRLVEEPVSIDVEMLKVGRPHVSFSKLSDEDAKSWPWVVFSMAFCFLLFVVALAGMVPCILPFERGEYTNRECNITIIQSNVCFEDGPRYYGNEYRISLVDRDGNRDECDVECTTENLTDQEHECYRIKGRLCIYKLPMKKNGDAVMLAVLAVIATLTGLFICCGALAGCVMVCQYGRIDWK